MMFVDTNYFLRFFIGTPVDQHQDAKTLFQKAARGEMKLCTSLVVMFEIYWVATSFYKFDKEKIVEFLSNILRMEFIEVECKDVFAEAVSLYAKSLFDLEDAYNLAYAQSIRVDDFVTFDVKVKKKFNE